MRGLFIPRDSVCGTTDLLSLLTLTHSYVFRLPIFNLRLPRRSSRGFQPHPLASQGKDSR